MNTVTKLTFLLFLLLVPSGSGFISNQSYQFPSISPNQNPGKRNITSSNLKSYNSGTYLVKNSDLTTEMHVIQRLRSIPYSIVVIEQNYRTSATLYPNRQIKLNELNNSNSLNKINSTAIVGNELRHELVDINIQHVWDQGYSGDGIVIAIIDTGIDFTNPALVGKKYNERSFHKVEYGFSQNKDPTPDYAHGTEVASVAAGYEENIFKSPAYSAKLVNARLGIVNQATTSLSVIAAYDWVISLPNVDIVSMSLSEIEAGYTIDPLEAMINAGVRAGKIMLSSAGNNGNGAVTPYQIGSPASAPEDIAVGFTSGTSLNPASSEGPTAGNQLKPDIVAPGTSIYAATISNKYNNYTSVSGSSFSTPLTSGAVAVLLEVAKTGHIDLTPGQMKSIIARSTNHLDLQVYQQGFGALNVSRAYNTMTSRDLQPIVGPMFNTAMDPRLTLPLNTDVYLPITLIGFSTTTFEIDTQLDQINLNYSYFYRGNTTIIVLDLFATANVSSSSIDLMIHNDGSDITYTIPVSIIAEPKYKVLLDLRHTIFDTVMYTTYLGFNARLERLKGIDIKGYAETIRADHGWITELLYQNFSIGTLQKYNILWMPTAFSTPVEPLYDHNYSTSQLTTEELFVLAQYIKQGGSIMADFDGSSYYSAFKFTTPVIYEEMMSYLTGINFNKIVTAPSSALTIPNLGMDKVISLPTGELQFTNGLPLVNGVSGYSAIAKITGFGGAIYLHDTRNWRDYRHIYDTKNQIYYRYILDLLTNPPISRINFETSGIAISFATPLISEVTDISLLIDNLTYLQDDYSLSSTTDSVEIGVPLHSGQQVNLTISFSNGQQLRVDQFVPEKEMNVLNSTLQLATNSSQTTEITVNFNKIQFIENTIQLQYLGQTIPVGFVQNRDQIMLTLLSNDIFPNSTNINDFTLKSIDKFGRYQIFNLGEIPVDSIPPSSSGNVFLLILSSGLLVAAVGVTIYNLYIKRSGTKLT